MKVFKQIVSIALVLVMTSSLAACAPKEFKHQKMVDFCEDHDMDEYDDYDDFIKDCSAHLTYGTADVDGIYFSCDKSDAQDIYDVIFNRFDPYPSYDVEQTTVFVFNDGDGGVILCYLFTMEDEKDAKKLYKKYSDQDIEDSEAGEEKGYTYYIETGENSKGKAMLEGFYVCGKTVLTYKTMIEDTDLIDDLCDTFKVKSPTELD
ncbi:MAG: hypothetical protein K6G47_09085 [Clostridia bacterium]|nr:hypothetical protein [Clostridia bacterium]